MYFHDGLFQRIIFNVEAREIVIHALMYSDQNARDRDSMTIKFVDVSFSSFTGDFNELLQNAFAGNIVDVRLPNGDKTTRVYMTGGTLIVCSESMLIQHVDVN